jgi:hypothetical protein
LYFSQKLSKNAPIGPKQSKRKTFISFAQSTFNRSTNPFITCTAILSTPQLDRSFDCLLQLSLGIVIRYRKECFFRSCCCYQAYFYNIKRKEENTGRFWLNVFLQCHQYVLYTIHLHQQYNLLQNNVPISDNSLSY